HPLGDGAHRLPAVRAGAGRAAASPGRRLTLRLGIAAAATLSRPMRRLAVPLLALALAAPAAAATIRGTLRSELLLGTPAPDRIVAGAGSDFVQAAFGGVDRVDCGPGRDVVTADASDRLAASCETVSRRLSVD